MGDILDGDQEDYVEDLVIPKREDFPDCDGDVHVRDDSFMRGEDDKRHFGFEQVPRGEKFGNSDYNPDTPRDVYAMMAVCFLFAIIYQVIKYLRERGTQ